MALRQWADQWKDEPTEILTRSDSLAALGAILKRSSASGAMNRVMQELALDLSEGTFEVEVVGHLPAVLNGWADSLSRLEAPDPERKPIPAALLAVPRATTASRTWTWWRTLSPPKDRAAAGGEGY